MKRLSESPWMKAMLAEQKRLMDSPGRESFVRSTLRAVSANDSRPDRSHCPGFAQSASCAPICQLAFVLLTQVR